MEMKSLKKHISVFFLVLLLSWAIFMPTTKAAGAELKRWTIHIVNGLSNDQTLLVHCKSKDDDLGEHNINVGTEFSWTFRVNIWNTTLFWCYLRKPNAQSVSFDAFWVEKTSIWLYYRCYDSNCIWTAKDDGIYLKDNPVKRDVLVHKWQ